MNIKILIVLLLFLRRMMGMCVVIHNSSANKSAKFLNAFAGACARVENNSKISTVSSIYIMIMYMRMSVSQLLTDIDIEVHELSAEQLPMFALWPNEQYTCSCC